MENIGDYIYLILIAAAALISFLKKGNAPNQAPPVGPTRKVPNEMDEVFPDFRELMREADYRNEEEEEEESEEYTTVVREEVKKEVSKIHEPFINVPTLENMVYKPLILSKQYESIKQTNNPDFQLDTDTSNGNENLNFDLRQAILFSEILKRPAY
jgi:hypothetical protein